MWQYTQLLTYYIIDYTSDYKQYPVWLCINYFNILFVPAPSKVIILNCFQFTAKLCSSESIVKYTKSGTVTKTQNVK